MNEQFPSVLLERAVSEFAKLPGIGRKTAMRLVLHLLRQDLGAVEAFAGAVTTLKREAKVVENIRDVMAVEATQQYHGLYHVLGGVISPIDGIGPGDLQIESLVQRVNSGGVSEVILALSTTMEGDSTNFYNACRSSHAASPWATSWNMPTK